MEENAAIQKLRQKLEEIQEELDICRKREQEAREAESYYRAFFDHGTDGIVILDPATARPIHFNEQACAQLGYTREEFRHLTVPDIEAKESPTAVRAHIDKITEIGHDEFDTIHRTKTGELRSVRVLAQVIPIGTKDVYHCIWRDITDSKQMEKSLRESEDRFRLTFNSSPDAVTINRLDDGAYVDVNEAFCRITGYSRDEVLGKSSIELGIWNDPEVRQELVKNLSEQGYSENIETQFRRKDGTLITGLMSARIITLNGVPHNIAVSRDITQHKLHEKERLKIEKLESLGILAGGIAHDFNNVLTGIMGNLSLAKVFLDDSHRALQPVLSAEKAAVRAGELAHQLLTFARGGEPVKKVIDVKNLIEEALSLTLHGSNVSAQSVIAENIHTLEADEGQISQVFHNTIINAIHAMPDGGILKVTAENTAMTEGNNFSLAPGPYLHLSLADEGCGIPAENLEKIFDPYFTTKKNGNGLGLASAFSIINRHGGHIDVKSAVGRGTVISMYLPSTGESTFTCPIETSEIVLSGNEGGAILIMDDEEMVLEIAFRILNHLGYEVTVCRNGTEALSLYQKAFNSGKPFLAVFMDLTIPGGMGGKEVAEHIRKLHTEAYLVVSSGYSNDHVMSNYSNYGFQAAIAKPYTVHDFTSILQAIPHSQKSA